jgi:hypothetical protein
MKNYHVLEKSPRIEKLLREITLLDPRIEGRIVGFEIPDVWSAL